jgi:hypothetical protein
MWPTSASGTEEPVLLHTPVAVLRDADPIPSCLLLPRHQIPNHDYWV